VPVHPIRRYCTNHKTTLAAFGRQFGISRQHVCDMVKGRSRPSPDLGLRIEKDTRGAITLRELYAWRQRG